MLVVLSAGMLTALTATAMSQGQTAFADRKKCEDNADNNCNDQNQNMKQKNECKIENENKDDSDNNDNTNQLICLNLGANPGGDLNNEGNGDQVFGLVP
jgi:hypothetical protein